MGFLSSIFGALCGASVAAGNLGAAIAFALMALAVCSMLNKNR